MIFWKLFKRNCSPVLQVFPNILPGVLLGLAPKKTGWGAKSASTRAWEEANGTPGGGTTNNSLPKPRKSYWDGCFSKTGINSPVEEKVVYIPLLRRFQKHLYYTKRLFSRRNSEPSTSMCHVSWISILTSNSSSMHHYDMLGNWCTILITLFDVISCAICDIIIICNNI